MERTNFFPYPARHGSGAEVADLSFDKDDSSMLTLEAEQEVYEFEHQLYNAALDPNLFPSAEQYRQDLDEKTTPLKPFVTTWLKKIISSDLGVNYFLEDSGRAALLATTGVNIEARSIEECTRELSSLETSGISSKDLDALEGDSIGYEEDKLTQAFINDGYHGKDLPSPEIVSVYKNPAMIIEKARGLQRIKKYANLALSDLKFSQTEEDSNKVNAEILIAELYRKRINIFLAGVYVEAYKFLHQYRRSGSGSHTDLVSKIESTLPAFFSQGDNPRISNFLQRMDRYRYGVSVDENDKFTWMSPEAEALATKTTNKSETDETVDRGVYSDIDLSLLESTMIEGVTFGEWFKEYLKQHDRLSEYEEWDSDREGRAPDGKWQVIVNKKFKNLAINDRQGVAKVPDKPISVLNAIEDLNHESVHVYQNDNKRALGDLAILQSIGLDQASEQTESGGMWQERIARETLTGKKDTDTDVAVGYFDMLEVKARGGTYGECVEAYYNYLLDSEPHESAEHSAAVAINRARRIFRSGGFEYAQDLNLLTNTQPLAYLEQHLIYESLNDDQRRLLFVGGMKLQTFAQLAKYGLVDIDNIYIPEEMPLQQLYQKVKDLVS
jgi:hypothetical protein